MSDRYVKQIMTPGVGLSGQQKLANATVLVVGAGGLGSHTAATLWASGVGQLVMYDGDVVAASNLARQLRYGPQDIGRLKVEVLAEQLRMNRDEPGLAAFAKTIDGTTVQEALQVADVICDCSDNAATRLLLDETCAALGKPLIYAAVRGWEGYVAVFNGRSGTRLQHLFSVERLRQEADDCATSGILGTTCGVVANLQACEAIKYLLGEPSPLDGGVFSIDCRSMKSRTFRLLK